MSCAELRASDLCPTYCHTSEVGQPHEGSSGSSAASAASAWIAQARPSRAERVEAHRTEWRAVYASLGRDDERSRSERGRLARPCLLRERALRATASRSDLSPERAGGAASLLALYLGARRIERCLAELRRGGARPPLVVGISPNGRDAPLDGPSGRRVASLLGLRDGAELRARLEVANLLRDGEVPSAALLRARAEALPTERRVVVLLGRAVARAFGVGDERSDLLRWTHVRPRGPAILVVPHPSGRCRWWNDPQNRGAAAAVLGRLAADLWGRKAA